MIPLDKLKRLPRSQRLRKIAKIFGETEYRLSRGGTAGEEATRLTAAAEFLLEDEGFSPALRTALGAAAETLRAAAAAAELIRPLNSIRHIILAETGRFPADWDFIDHRGRLDPCRRTSFAGMEAYLEDIRSPFNVGSLFRSAESFGVEKLWLSPLCADPRHPRAARSAMGCVDMVPWERLGADPFPAGTAGRPATGFSGPCFALETGGVPLGDFHFPPRGMMLVGSEELGLSPGALAAAEASLGRVSIPSRGVKGSLNVSVAFGIVMQAWAAALADYD
jgi:TrmH family RNA methyltransferase